jgi:hypothetical protein
MFTYLILEFWPVAEAAIPTASFGCKLFALGQQRLTPALLGVEHLLTP